jgi:hypothetical protein
VSGLASVFFNNESADLAETFRQVGERSKIAHEQLDPKVEKARIYYISQLQNRLSVILQALERAENVTTAGLLKNAFAINNIQRQLLITKNARIQVGSTGPVIIPEFSKLIVEIPIDNWNNPVWDSFTETRYLTTPTWRGVANDYTQGSSTPFISKKAKYPIELMNNTLYFSSYLLSDSYPENGLKELSKEENLNSYYAVASHDLNWFNTDISKSYVFLKKMAEYPYTIDLHNDSTVKENYKTQRANGDKSWKYIYYAGACGLKKVNGMTLLADVIADSAIAKKDIKQLRYATGIYNSAWEWFSTNLKTNQSWEYNNAQYGVLSALFDNVIKCTALLNKYDEGEQMNHQIAEQVLNNLLSYVTYSSSYFNSIHESLK